MVDLMQLLIMTCGLLVFLMVAAGIADFFE